MFDTLLGAANVDTIADFTHSRDKLSLDRTVFAQLADGAVLTDAQFYAAADATAALDADDRIIYNTTTGALYYDADGNGVVASAVQFAVLTTLPTLTAGDFVIVA